MKNKTFSLFIFTHLFAYQVVVASVVVVAVVAAVVDDCFHFLVLMKPFERNRQRLMSPLCHLQKKRYYQ